MKCISALLDLLFPPKCIFCRRVLDGREREGKVCRCCRDTIEYNETLVRPSGSLDTLCAPLVYRAGVRKAILSMKFSDRPDYAKPLGRFIADEVARRYRGGYDVVTWVPLSRKRLRKRGYDQAKLLAEEAALRLDTVAVPTLEKIRDNRRNSSLDAAKRASNVRGAYVVTDRASVEGKRVLIIDDVYTTGSTMGECARMLREAGAAAVIGATVAVAGVGEDMD